MAEAADSPQLKRERATLDAATLTSGAEQVIDFVLPIFAGAVLGLSALQTGILLGATQLAAFVCRPIAGVIVDRGNKSLVAAGGAAGYGLACIGFGFATGFAMALAAAVVAGTAGAFMWVAIRAIIGERLAEDSAVFAKLVAAEETGGWLVLVPAIIVLSAMGYGVAFFALAACCLVAAVLLVGQQKPASPRTIGSDISLGKVGARLRPMLIAVVITMAAEAAIGLLLLLHLQRGFGLELMEIAYVFLPGAIAMSILPPYMHRIVVALGRRLVLIAGSVASAAFAVGLAFAPNPWWIAGLWVLSAVAWSAVLPVQQAIIAEAAGRAHLGRGLSLYEAATLAGAFVGSLAAGMLYETGSWRIACLVSAVVIASGVLIIPRAVAKLDLPDKPPAAPMTNVAKDTPPPSHGNPAPQVPRGKERKSRRKLLSDLAWHAGIYLPAMLLALAFIPTVTRRLIGQDSTPLPSSSDGLSLVSIAPGALRVWTIIFVIDVIWTAYDVAFRAAPQRSRE